MLAPPPEDAGETDSDAGETTPTAAPCKITPAWLQPHKACSVDADCETLAYRSGCCATQAIVGIAHADKDVVQTCANDAPPLCAANSRCSDDPDRAEDGRAVLPDGSNVAVRCIQNSCQSEVTTRPCGKALTCKADEVCTIYENVPGSTPAMPVTGENAQFTYQCDKNPCAQRLDCKCAQSLCDARMDVARMCEIELTDVSEGDVYCQRVPE